MANKQDILLIKKSLIEIKETLRIIFSVITIQNIDRTIKGVHDTIDEWLNNIFQFVVNFYFIFISLLIANAYNNKNYIGLQFLICIFFIAILLLLIKVNIGKKTLTKNEAYEGLLRMKEELKN